MKKTPSVETQLGFYIGEYIYHRYLPTLSTDSLQSRKVITVSKEDEAENKRLEKQWFDSTRKQKFQGKENDNPLWIEYYNHNKMLEKKYLPHLLKCRVPGITVENIDDVKAGIIQSLWDCDLCAYSLKPENINIYNETDIYFTVVELKLGVTVGD